jgi:predicted nuclease with TOPRIM domain
LLVEARRVFASIAREFPSSVKVEAARYGVSIIDFRRRENEMLKLLKWSHEETLKTGEEFQRRERDYEQAVAVLRRRIAEFERDDLAALVTQKEGQVASLRSQIAELEDSQSLLQTQLATSNQRLAALSANTAAAAAGSAELLVQARLLELKQRALTVQQGFQIWLALQEQAQ